MQHVSAWGSSIQYHWSCFIIPINASPLNHAKILALRVTSPLFVLYMRSFQALLNPPLPLFPFFSIVQEKETLK